MATTEQRRKRRRKRERIDRLSALPDSALCHILSFLMTVESVRTSVLAKRWRYLWPYVPTLEFDSVNEDFIRRAMSLHKMQTITTFRLFLSEDDDYSHKYEKWIAAAINRSVQNLDLLSFHDSTLPQCLFTCETLVDLSLCCWGVMPSKCAVYWPRLKKLHLTSAQFEADESLPNMLSGCPVLEELLIEPRSDLSDVFAFNISSLTLKRLTINKWNGGRSNTLELNTPALSYLEMFDFYYWNIRSGVMTSLTEAYVILYNDKDTTQDVLIYSRSLLEFIGRLCNVKCLRLVLSEFKGIIDSVLSAWCWTISFHNLTKLELDADCRFLPKFLECADNLETLIFSECYEKAESWTEPPQVPKCLLSHLRIIKLVGVRGKKHEFEYIRYFLMNALVLERMEIAYWRLLGLAESFNMLKKISLLRRGSNACEVAFVQG